MNYLTELLAFYRWLETNPVSPLLQSYWHLLMYYNNKAAVQGGDGGWYWPVCFRLPNTVLMRLLSIKDRRVLLRQRQYLIDHGRVTYQRDTGQRSGIYRMTPFDSRPDGCCPAIGKGSQCDTNLDTNCPAVCDTSVPVHKYK